MNELTNTPYDHHGENDKESTYTKKMLALWSTLSDRQLWQSCRKTEALPACCE